MQNYHREKKELFTVNEHIVCGLEVKCSHSGRFIKAVPMKTCFQMLEVIDAVIGFYKIIFFKFNFLNMLECCV